SVGEDVVPGHLGMGTDHDALVGLDQNDLVLQPEGLGPLRRKANPIPRFDHGGLGRFIVASIRPRPCRRGYGYRVNLVVFLRWSVQYAHWEVIHERCKASIDDLRLSREYCIRSGIDDRGPGPPDRTTGCEGCGDSHVRPQWGHGD